MLKSSVSAIHIIGLHQRGFAASEGGDKPKRGRSSKTAAAAAAAAAAATEAHGYSHGGEASPSRGPPPSAAERRPGHQTRFTGSASSAPPAPPISPERLSQVETYFCWVKNQCSSTP